MKKQILSSFLFLTLFFTGLEAQKFFTRDGVIHFTSEAPLEKIEAKNNNVASVLDTETGKLEFAVLIKAFQFEKALMQEHFNENYMESSKYPKAVFKGQIDNFKDIDFLNSGKQEVTVSGNMSIHGVTNEISVTGILDVQDENIHAKSTFTVAVADYDIEIPKVVRDNIAKEVEIVVDMDYKPFNQLSFDWVQSKIQPDEKSHSLLSSGFLFLGKNLEMKNILTLIFFLMIISPNLKAQGDDLLSILEEEETTDYAIAAFKTNRVIHGHSIENTAGGVLDFKISHRFGMLNSGFHELFGLDNAMIRFGFDYGITDRLQVGVGRNSFRKIYDGYVKYKILRQSMGAQNMPVTAAIVVAYDFTGTKNNPDSKSPSFSKRLAYTYQMLIGSKLSDKFSLQFMPTYVHRNLVAAEEKNDVVALGLAFRQKMGKRVALYF